MKKHIRISIVFGLLFLFVSLNLKAQIEDLKVGTTTRKMLVYAPSSIVKNRPLLISMHGLNQDITYQQNQTQWETVADANNFVVVYPAGINNSWDLGGNSDTDFILAIINEMANRYAIDRDRVYLSGFSMGGMMTYHAANVIADKIAAFAPVSGYLMSGPNTNSLRPIPIIHTHGTSDDVVPFSGVQACMDAWVKRNGCPTAAQVTQPYPSSKPTSNATKYYWGPGTDNVSIVLLRIEGVGHWHSSNSAGVNTSEEIWNFCKNYSLGYGVPRFISACVTENNPNQINVRLSKSLINSQPFTGFSVMVDNQSAQISSIALEDTSKLVINLANSIQKTNEIKLSYSGGNVKSIYQKALAAFSNVSVDNNLIGAAPKLVEVKTNVGGDSLFAKFNMAMKQPDDLSSLALNATYNGKLQVPFNKCILSQNDPTQLIFILSQKVYADYSLSLSYSGNNISTTDNGLLKSFVDFPVNNYSKGLPVTIQSGKLETDGISITLSFSKPMVVSSDQYKYFSVKVNGTTFPLKSCSAYMKTIKLTISNNSIHYGDNVIVGYTPGNVVSADKGPLTAFDNVSVQNGMNPPAWVQLPAKIEAEAYTVQSGTQTEQTSDTGGGQDVGWIDTGDWMEYAINNTLTNSLFDFSFRVASPYNGCKFDYYIDGVKTGTITIPNTANWQSFQSVNATVNIPNGKHYLKLIATSGGFNLNFINVIVKSTGVNELNVKSVTVSPNPVNDKIVIQAGDFVYKKVEIIDLTGKQLFLTNNTNTPEIKLPVNIVDGVYLVRISNDAQSCLSKIIVRRK
ncbi:MAG: carbohydrate-binding protein [Bacteroidota bacterium]|nr:carbohydrate-binding protein [Bacteroidota bacterium]